MTKTLSIAIPEYRNGEEPDSVVVGARLDALLKEHWSRQEVIIRCISSADHASMNLEQLANVVLQSGTDKYDSIKSGIGYEVSKNKKIDLFGIPALVNDKPIFKEIIEDFYHSAIGDRGHPLRLDLIMIYDSLKLEMVKQLYEGHVESDAFVFKDLNNKPQALLSLIKVL